MENRSITRLLVSLASLCIIIAGIKATAGLTSQILLALFIVLVCSPIVVWLSRRGLPEWLARVIVVLGVVAVGLLLIAFLGLSITQLTLALPKYQSMIAAQLSGVKQFLNSIGVSQADLQQLDLFDPGKLIQLTIAFIQGLLGTLSSVGLTLFIFIYMLAGTSSFSKKLNRALVADNPMLDRLNNSAKSISLYLLIKGWLGAMTAIGQIILLWIVGVDFAILWGILSFLFNFIPSIGYIISVIPPTLMALLQFGLIKAVIVFVGYALINNFFDMAIGPRYLGQGLDLSTFVTFLSVILWTLLLGPIGAFLALPLTVMLKKLVLETHSDTQLIASLMGADEGKPDKSDKSLL
ncbi:AI-2E family transporter [Lyngbya sp. CCY1209]|uniref:AI-2E family transporter n=1 Tax=Lyngbya sp. CCY1209 TaxID=2886103 RepID=UPI002D210466|nr:AI-2E family transporter [Lyngbya sp. CCY1209]MEB3886899.1 AI-2E family transporter [Lyngbya sp. CCY1209]